MTRLRKRSRMLVSVLLTFFCATTAFAVTYDDIVVFGDSLSDHYGLYTYLEQLIGEYDAVDNPEGVREAWTNGNVWVEYLADLWLAELDNWAIAGAMTEGHEDTYVQSLMNSGQLPDLGMTGQVDRYLAEAPRPLPDTTLYIIWIGGNDLLVYGRGESDAETAEDLIAGAVSNISSALDELYEAGARKFLILLLPDFGLTPAFLNQSEEAQAAATNLADSFNTILRADIVFHTLSWVDTDLHWFDAFSFLHDIIDEGTFTDTTGTYLVLDENGDDTGETNEPASDYLFWDTIHPTTLAHSYIADEIDYQLGSEDDVDDNGIWDESGGDDGGGGCFISNLF